MPGDEMEITAGVGAFSKAAAPIITIDGSGVANWVQMELLTKR